MRKAGFDLPSEVRDQLIELINDTFGPWNIDDNDMYFGADAYKEYLEKNSFHDNDETRYLYSALFIKELYQRLDVIFSQYRN